jgi:hypothetical protein
MTDPRTIATRLGLDETDVRRLQARGYLLTLDLREWEIRDRLFRAHTDALGLSPKRRSSSPPPAVRT